MKKIPLKNYIILGIILIISIIVVLYITNWFLATKNHNQKNNIMSFIKEVKISEFDNYITENPNFIIYLKSSNSNNKFEKKLKKFLIDYDLQKEFVYINIDNFDIKQYTNFVNEYKKNEILINFDESIMIVDNQKIVSVLYKEKEFNIKNVKKFLKDNGVY